MSLGARRIRSIRVTATLPHPHSSPPIPALLLFAAHLIAASANAQASFGSTTVPQATSTSTPRSGCFASWQVVTSPNPSSTTNYLNAVTAISPNDVWAVGEYNYDGLNPGSATLTLHWDGQAWTRIPSPNVGTQYDSNSLFDVDAVSSNDVWAGGEVDTVAPGSFTLIEHWDGVQWSIVPSPNVPNTTNGLASVSAISSNDVWAVGYYLQAIGSGGWERTFVQHWDGTQWTTVPSPNPNIGEGHNALWAVSALSSNDVWASGYYTDFPTGYTLVEHWDGTQWSVVSSPNPCTSCGNSLYGVDTISSNDVWAVGQTRHSGGGEDTLIEHWDGSQWSIVGSPNGGSSNELDDVRAVSPTDVWAVGYGGGALLEHWDGNGWSVMSSPSGGYLLGVVALSSTDVWAVGYLHSCQGGPCGWHTLTEHYSDPCASFTPTPISTPSPSSSPILSPTVPPTITDTPLPALVGHVNWESRPAQPDARQSLPITFTLKSGTLEANYPVQTTDQYGYFTVTIGTLPSGTYSWRADDAPSPSHPSNYLANSGTLSLTGAPTTSVEMGKMRAGDASNDNVVNLTDFNIMKVTFGLGCGQPGYDSRADFSGDCLVNVADFTPLKANFGHGGAPPISPRAPGG